MLYLYRKKEKGIPILIAALRPASLIKTKVFFYFTHPATKINFFNKKKTPSSKQATQTHKHTDRERGMEYEIVTTHSR